MKYLIKTIFTPDCWDLSYPVSKEWDAKLNYLMDNHEFCYLNKYKVKLGDTLIWIRNHPYASFREINEQNMIIDQSPKRRTMFKAADKLKFQLDVDLETPSWNNVSLD